MVNCAPRLPLHHPLPKDPAIPLQIPPIPACPLGAPLTSSLLPLTPHIQRNLLGGLLQGGFAHSDNIETL